MLLRACKVFATSRFPAQGVLWNTWSFANSEWSLNLIRTGGLMRKAEGVIIDYSRLGKVERTTACTEEANLTSWQSLSDTRFLAFYAVWIFIIMFTRSSHWFTSRARLIQYTASCPVSTRHFNIIILCMSASPERSNILSLNLYVLLLFACVIRNQPIQSLVD